MLGQRRGLSLGGQVRVCDDAVQNRACRENVWILPGDVRYILLLLQVIAIFLVVKIGGDIQHSRGAVGDSNASSTIVPAG